MRIVYILTNECMPDAIKVGVTDNLEQRIKDLYKTNVPLPFECYYAVEVSNEKAAKIEKQMHQGLDDYRIHPKREFFEASPEIAKSLLEIAEVMGGKNVTPTATIVETPQDQQALEKAHEKRGKPVLAELDIEPGTMLEFKKDNTVTCEVIDKESVLFRGEKLSLSSAALMALKEVGYDWQQARGPIWWCLNGKTLHDLRLMSRE